VFDTVRQQQPSRTALRHGCDPLSLTRSRKARRLHGHPIVGSRFVVDTVSDGRLAVCCCLLRFANRRAMKPNRDASGVGACHERDRQSPWLPRRTRARNQDDRKEARLVLVRMLHEGGDAAARFEWIDCGVSNPCSQSQYHKNDRPLEPNGWGSHDDSFVTWASLKTPICCRVLCGSHAATPFGNFNANVPEYARLTIKALALGKKVDRLAFDWTGQARETARLRARWRAVHDALHVARRLRANGTLLSKRTT